MASQVGSARPKEKAEARQSELADSIMRVSIARATLTRAPRSTMAMVFANRPRSNVTTTATWLADKAPGHVFHHASVRPFRAPVPLHVLIHRGHPPGREPWRRHRSRFGRVRLARWLQGRACAPR